MSQKDIQIEFGDPDAIAERNPHHHERWFIGSDREPEEGRGMTGTHVRHPKHGDCISLFVGQGTSVLINSDGILQEGDNVSDPDLRVEGGAWISEHEIARAERIAGWRP